MSHINRLIKSIGPEHFFVLCLSTFLIAVTIYTKFAYGGY